MAINRYIGARYVPKLMGEWNINVDYEPLSVVTHNRNSYTSRKFVPNGTQITNLEYWAVTGVLDAQILQINTRIDNLDSSLTSEAHTRELEDNKLDSSLTSEAHTRELEDNKLYDLAVTLFSRSFLNGKNVVAYGDSTIVDNEGGAGESYLKRACRLAGANLTNRAVAGTQMKRYDNNGISLINAANDLNKFDYIFLCYGTNEWTTSTDAEYIEQSVDEIIATVRNKNATATIVFIIPPFSFHDFGNQLEPGTNNVGLSFTATMTIITERLIKNGVPYIDLNAKSTCNRSNVTVCMNPGEWNVHPTPEFRKELASLVLDGPDRSITECYTSIIDNMDFVNARTFTSQDAPAFWSGVCIKVANTTSSRAKFLDGNELLFVGEVLDNKTARIVVRDKAFNVSGKFEVRLKPQFSVIPITITGDNVTITGFDVFVVTKYPKPDSYRRFFGGDYIVNPTNSKISGAIKLCDIKDGIMLDTSAITFTAGSYTSGEVLFTLPADINFNPMLYPLFLGNNEWYMLYISGNTISCGGNRTFIENVTGTVIRTQLLNPAYPNTGYTA